MLLLILLLNFSLFHHLELIKLKNDLKVFLINDNYTSYSSFYVETPHGYAIDTFNGLAHLSEHLSFAGNSNSEKAYKMF